MIKVATTVDSTADRFIGHWSEVGKQIPVDETDVWEIRRPTRKGRIPFTFDQVLVDWNCFEDCDTYKGLQIVKVIEDKSRDLYTVLFLDIDNNLCDLSFTEEYLLDEVLRAPADVQISGMSLDHAQQLINLDIISTEVAKND